MKEVTVLGERTLFPGWLELKRIRLLEEECRELLSQLVMLASLPESERDMMYVWEPGLLR